MASKIPNQSELGILSHIGQAMVNPEEKNLASTGRVLVNLCTAPAVPFAAAGAALGALAAKLIGGDQAKGGRAGSLVGGAFGAVATVIPLFGMVATAAYLGIKGVRQDPKSAPEKVATPVDLLNKTWRNACALLDTCFPATAHKIDADEVSHQGEISHAAVAPKPKTSEMIVKELNVQVRKHPDNKGKESQSLYTANSYKETYMSFIAKHTGYPADLKYANAGAMRVWFTSLQRLKNTPPVAGEDVGEGSKPAALEMRRAADSLSPEMEGALTHLLDALTFVEKMETSNDVFAKAAGAVFTDEDKASVEADKALQDIEKTPQPDLKTKLDDLKVTESDVEEAFRGLGNLDERSTLSRENAGGSTLPASEYKMRFNEAKSVLCDALGIENRSATLSDIKSAYETKKPLLPIFAQIQFEKQMNRLESMEFLLKGVPANSDLTSEFFKTGVAILKQVVEQEVHRTNVDALSFLQGLTYIEGALPHNYLETKPKDMIAVEHNLAILEDCTNKEDVYNVKGAAIASSNKFYANIEPTVSLLKSSIATKLGLEDEGSYTAKELKDNYQTKIDHEPPLMDKDKNLENLLDELERFESDRIKDSQIGDVVQKSKDVETPSPAELFYSKIFREYDQTRSSIEKFGSRTTAERNPMAANELDALLEKTTPLGAAMLDVNTAMNDLDLVLQDLESSTPKRNLKPEEMSLSDFSQKTMDTHLNRAVGDVARQIRNGDTSGSIRIVASEKDTFIDHEGKERELAPDRRFWYHSDFQQRVKDELAKTGVSVEEITIQRQQAPGWSEKNNNRYVNEGTLSWKLKETDVTE